MARQDPPVGIYPTATVKDVAESLALDKLSDETARAIAGDVEYRLNLVIQEAQKFMRHGKRRTLDTRDVDHALDVLNVAPILHPPPPLAKPTFLPVYASSSTKQEQQQQLYYLQDEEIDLMTYLRDARKNPPRVNVMQDNEDAPESSAKGSVRWKAHWLAVEGVQPMTKDNPVVGGEASSSAAMPTGPVAAADAGVSAGGIGQTLATQVLSKELQLLFERLTSALVPDPREYVPIDLKRKGKKKDRDREGHTGANGQAGEGSGSKVDANGDTSMADGMAPVAAGASSNANSAAGGAAATGSAANGAPAAAPAEDRSTLTLLEQSRLAALSTLSTDPALLPLLPYLIRWLAEAIESTITVSLGGAAAAAATASASGPNTGGAARPAGMGGAADLRDTASLGIGKDVVGRERMMGRMGRMSMGWLIEGLDALSRNDSLFIEPYLHQLLPPVLSTLLCSSLGPATLPEEADADAQHKPPTSPDKMHLRSGTDVRLLAGDLLGRLITTYGREYETLVPRIVGTLVKALKTPPQPNVTKQQPPLRRTPSSSGAQQNGSGNKAGQTLAAGSPTSGRYEGALIALRALGPSALVTALVGDSGVGLLALGHVLDGLAPADKHRLAKLTLDYLETSIPAREAELPPDAGHASFSGFGDLFARHLRDRPALAANLIAEYSRSRTM